MFIMTFINRDEKAVNIGNPEFHSNNYISYIPGGTGNGSDPLYIVRLEPY